VIKAPNNTPRMKHIRQARAVIFHRPLLISSRTEVSVARLSLSSAISSCADICLAYLAVFGPGGLALIENLEFFRTALMKRVQVVRGGYTPILAGGREQVEVTHEA
jgi:hypothetical protein